MADEGEKMSENSPAEVFSPGEFLEEELEARGWSQAEFAEILGRPKAVVSEIVRGKRAITPATAKELAAALGTSAMLWMNLDAAYQLNKVEAPPARIALEAKLRGAYPIRDMVARRWIEYSEDPAVLEARVLHFFKISRVEDTPAFPHAARKGGAMEGYDKSSPIQLAWLYRVKQVAESIQAPLYSHDKLRERLREMRDLMVAPAAARDVPRLLNDAGVRFVVVEPLPGSKIDGVCFWLSPTQPVIGMSLRFDRIDNFWFVLRHEIEHVLNEDGSIDVDLDPGQSDASEQERKANAAASAFGVSPAVMEDFIARKGPLLSAARVTNFAQVIGVHPGIVAGQLRFRLERYDLFTKLMAKIREHVTPFALTDGYGQVAPV